MPSALRQRLQLRSARRAGKKDGRRGIPLPDEAKTYPYSLTAIGQRAEEELFELSGSHGERDRTPKADYMAASERLDNLRAELKAKMAHFGEREKERDAEAKADKLELERLEKERRATLRPVAEPDPMLSDEAKIPAPQKPGPDLVEASSGGAALALDPQIASDPQKERPEPLAAVSEMPGREEATTAPTHAGMRSFTYWSIIFLIIVGEIPLNAIAFRIFGESNALTYVMTLSVALVLIFVAHFLGATWSRDELTFRERLFIAVGFVVPIISIVAIGIIRTKYLQGRGEADVTLRYLGPWLSTLTFVLINCLIFVGAIALSLMKHDPHTSHNIEAAKRREFRGRKRDFERESKLTEKREKAAIESKVRRQRESDKLAEKEAKRKAQIAERHLSAKEREEALARRSVEERKRLEEASFLKRESVRNNERAAERRAITILENEIDRLLGAVKNLKAQRDALADATQADAKRIRKYYERVMSAYCAANIRARKDRTTPPILKTLPEIEIPDELREVLVEWD